MSGADERPITDELVCLKQAIDLLKVAEDLVQPENIERYPGAIASVIRTARTLVEEVLEALNAHFAKGAGDSPH
jgi:hypothetical protein